VADCKHKNHAAEMIKEKSISRC